MKFKFFYAKHKVTGEFVSMEHHADNEGMIFTGLGLSHWESDMPYMSSFEDLTRLLNGEYNDSWCTNVYDSLKKAIKKGEMEIVEVEL